MPTIFVNGPPMKDRDKKRELVKGITDTVEKVYGVPRDAVTIVVREDEASNVARGGRLISDQ
jgi:4-oxalocrotonate tautomerase